MRSTSPFYTVLRSGRAGLAFAAASLAAAVAAATGFLDPMSLLITLGGALAVTRVTFSKARIAGAWRHLAAALADDGDVEAVIAAIKQLARVHRVEGAPALERAAQAVPDPFLTTAVRLGLECEDEQELRDALHGEVRRQAADGEAARQVLVTLGKLFPAFGLIGTLIGLALLLRNMADASLASIGPGLGIAVLTTLYGAVLANVVALPLATKLQTYLARRVLLMEMIGEGTLLVYRREYPTRIERTLRAAMGLPALGGADRGPLFVADRAA